MDYIIKKTTGRKGRGSGLTIMGLAYVCAFEEVDPTYADRRTPDTEMVLLGMYHGLDSLASVLQATYATLYDITQTSVTPVRDGDTFTAPAMVWKLRNGKGFKVPEQRFAMQGCHLVAMHDIPVGEVTG